MECFWKWIGNLGSLASLIALPIALVQIHLVKKKLKDTETITNRFISRAEKEKLEHIKSQLSEIHTSVLHIQVLYKTTGLKDEVLASEVENSIIAINQCVHDLPSEYMSESNSLKNAIRNLNTFAECKDSVNKRIYILDAGTYIENAILSLKKSIEQKVRDELTLIASSEKNQPTN